MDRVKGWKKYVEQSEKLVIDTFDESVIDKDFVRKLRNSGGFTQNIFSKIVGVSQKTIEKWEQGKNPVNPSSKRLLFLLFKRPSIINDIYSEKIILGNKFVKITDFTDFNDTVVGYFNTNVELENVGSKLVCDSELINTSFQKNQYKVFATNNLVINEGDKEIAWITDRRLAS